MHLFSTEWHTRKTNVCFEWSKLVICSLSKKIRCYVEYCKCTCNSCISALMYWFRGILGNGIREERERSRYPTVMASLEVVYHSPPTNTQLMIHPSGFPAWSHNLREGSFTADILTCHHRERTGVTNISINIHHGSAPFSFSSKPCQVSQHVQ